MTETRGPFRHAPNEPKEFITEMCERTSQAGDRYLYGFGSGKKWLLFLDKRAYTQELTAPIVPELPVAPARGPGGGELVAHIPATPEPRTEFVSGLPDDWGQR